MSAARLAGLILTLAMTLAAAGCGSVPGSAGTPTAFGGPPPNAPPAPAEQPAFPNVYDQLPARPAKLITEEEQARLEAELTALRKRINSRADALEKEKIGDNR